MKRTKLILTTLLWCGMLLPGFSQVEKKSDLEISNLLEMETAYEFDSEELQKSEWIWVPELQYDFSRNLRLTAIGRLYSEWTDRLEPGTLDNSSSSRLSGRQALGDRAEIELREFYLDYWLKNGVSLRLGKQQIVWGETDGLKLLDVINPQYFREFILDDFEDSRIPLWSVKVEFPLTKSIDAELIWIPDLTYHAVPAGNGRYFPGNYYLPEPPEGMDVVIQKANKPDRAIADSDVGARFSTFIGGWDLSVSYLYHYNDLQNFELQLTPSTVTILQSYERQHMTGLAFNKALGELVLRGEMAVHFDRSFLTDSFVEGGGLKQTDHVQTALGLDWLTQETFISAQVFNDALSDDIGAFNRDQSVWSGSLLISQEFLNDNLKIENLWVHEFNRGDGMLRPKASYLLNSNLWLSTGADIFYGEKAGLFGQFDQRDRVWIGMEVGF